MADKTITDTQADKIAEPLEEVQQEVIALLRELDRDEFVSQEGWIDCLDRIKGHLDTVRGIVRTL